MEDLSRTDITNKVRGEMTDDCIVLTHNGQEIGHIPIDGANFTMNAGYEMNSQRIFRMLNDNGVEVNSYVEHCDGGWC